MSQVRSMIVVVLVVPAVIAFSLWAFLWPSARLAPRDLPLGVAGATAAVAPVKAQLEEREGAFEVHGYPDATAARTAIKEREVYGAVVVTDRGPRLLVASAAAPVVAQLLTESLGERDGRTVPTEDVVPLPENDPRGTALNSSALPMALAGIAMGAAVSTLGLRGLRALVTVLAAAAVIGLVAAAVTDSWLGALAGDWWAEAGAFALAALAGGATVAGFAALLGPAGIGLGALVMMLLGNPFSGVTSAPQLLPEPVGTLGQLLPPGAGGSLLRSVAYFDGHGVAGPLATLGVWTVLGLALVLLGPVLRARRTADASSAAGAPA
ncbi:ABC transporter permease [Streptomyces sp. NPDC054784]